MSLETARAELGRVLADAAERLGVDTVAAAAEILGAQPEHPSEEQLERMIEEVRSFVSARFAVPREAEGDGVEKEGVEVPVGETAELEGDPNGEPGEQIGEQAQQGIQVPLVPMVNCRVQVQPDPNDPSQRNLLIGPLALLLPFPAENARVIAQALAGGVLPAGLGDKERAILNKLMTERLPVQ